MESSSDKILWEALDKQFRYYKALGERTFEQLTAEQLHWRPNESSNSIAILVGHLSGNMKSRFTDFLTSDGEKEWRKRDQEFEDTFTTNEDLMVAWEDGWTCVFSALSDARKEDPTRIVYIRNIGHTISEAFLRQLAHYSYHIGQIVQLGVMQMGSQWKSLSIPKGQSGEYNRKAFAEQKKRGHFTDQFLEKE